MRRLQRSWAVASVLVLLTAGDAAPTGIPNNSITPPCVILVPPSVGAPGTAMGEFTVTVRDLANNPVVGARVDFDVEFCDDLYLCTHQSDPDLVVSCDYKRVSKFTDAQGTVRMTVLGGSNGTGNATTLLTGGRIYANGTLIGSPTVSALDLDGAVGLGPNDLSAFLSDFASGQPYGRSDYDCSNGLSAGDLSIWLQAFATGTMVASCASNCP